MEHNHGNEYQIRIIRENGTEELSGWTDSTEQIALAMLAVHRPQGTTYSLLIRTILCPDCSEREQIITECPLTNIPSPRCSPTDSHYLVSVGLKDRYAVDFSELLHIVR